MPYYGAETHVDGMITMTSPQEVQEGTADEMCLGSLMIVCLCFHSFSTRARVFVARKWKNLGNCFGAAV